MENDTKSILDISIRYRLLNSLVSNGLIGSLVVIYWVSTWQLVETVLFFPNDICLSILTSMAVSLSVYFVVYAAQDYLYKLITGYSHAWSMISLRLYTYVLAFASVNLWRYSWRAYDKLTSGSIYSGLATFFGGFLTMSLMNCSLQLMEVPSAIGLDLHIKPIVTHDTYFRTKSSTWQHVLDSLFTATIVPFLVVTVWRGLWVIWDNVLAPGDPLVSGLYCLAISIPLYTVLQLIRTSWMRLSAWTDDKFWLWKYLVEDTHTLLSAVVCITHWRGIWFLYDQVPLDAPLRYWLGHFIGFPLLASLCATNSMINQEKLTTMTCNSSVSDQTVDGDREKGPERQSTKTAVNGSPNLETSPVLNGASPTFYS